MAMLHRMEPHAFDVVISRPAADLISGRHPAAAAAIDLARSIRA
jgi:hypothetical protein